MQIAQLRDPLSDQLIERQTHMAHRIRCLLRPGIADCLLLAVGIRLRAIRSMHDIVAASCRLIDDVHQLLFVALKLAGEGVPWALEAEQRADCMHAFA